MCGCAAEQNSDSYLASENIKPETLPAARQNAENCMEPMSRRCREKGERLYLPEEELE